LGPIVFIVFVFAKNILGIWLGVEFAEKTSLVFQILALGMLLNAFAQMPAFLLDSIGRPDLRAKTFLLYIMIYIGLLWFLISKLGIVGAAIAWTIRAGLELSLFFGMAWKIGGFNWETFVKNGIVRSTVAYLLVISIGLMLVVLLGKTILIQGVITLGCLVIFLYYVWRCALEDGEKRSISLAIRSLGSISK
jgi:O-antigen/teichoic acid export membrane protein